MQETLFTVLGITCQTQRKHFGNDGGEVITFYQPRELFNKWVNNSELGVAIIEQAFRQIAGDKPSFDDLKEIIFDYLYKKEVFRSSDYRDMYYEIKQVLNYAVNAIVIDAEEAILIIVSGIRKVHYHDYKLSIITVLNEREVHGDVEIYQTKD